MTYFFEKPGKGNDIAHNGAAYASPTRPMTSGTGGAVGLYAFKMLVSRTISALYHYVHEISIRRIILVTQRPPPMGAL